MRLRGRLRPPFFAGAIRSDEKAILSLADNERASGENRNEFRTLRDRVSPPTIQAFSLP